MIDLKRPTPLELAAQVSEAVTALQALGELVTPDRRVRASGAAVMIGVRQKTLRNWRSDGIGPRWFMAGVPWYRLEDVIEWLNEQERNAVAQVVLDRP